MDGHRFDGIVRKAAGMSRRRLLAAVAAGFAGAVVGRGTTAQATFPDTRVMTCGGIMGGQCPSGYTCVDVASDGCDPNAGGADCIGVCVPVSQPTNPCAAMLCEVGTECCPNCGGVCVAAGTNCAAVDCGPMGEPCGPSTCGAGEYCCNESCGICAPIGGSCTEQFCGEPCGNTVCGLGEYCCNASCSVCAGEGEGCTRQYCEEQTGPPCGPTTCAVGEVCCNDSCGICTPPDGFCTLQLCVDDPPGEVCGSTVCPVGEVCCNASCGICTPPGGMCIQIACE